MDRREKFLSLQGQTTPFPYLLDIDYAKGIYMYDKQGKAFMDMIAGVAVNNIGHNHPKVVDALKQQIDKHLHVMVYGEFIQDAPLLMAERLTAILPEQLNCVYSVNSGAEANEAALKLAKRVTGRSQIIAFKGAYHGGTHGALSVSANETKKEKFRPLLPGIKFITFNSIEELEAITDQTAAVIMETVQGDAGVRKAQPDFMRALRDKCTQTGAQLIFDEVQCGIGRTGQNFAFEMYENVVPDILTLGKALGGGMPIGAFVSSQEKMKELTHDPMLGHITTFGGHPVVAAAAAATLEVLTTEIDYTQVEANGQLLVDMLQYDPEIKEIRRVGMMFAFDMESFERVEKVVNRCLELGLISFWFLSHPYSFRLSPPINITREEMKKAGEIILQAIEETREK
ncbi:Acetylornithine/succinyldiaminopimelate/putrescine aminotransferase [Lishizhenia tianjinensis]|uniref:Acetylornithine/succinyldiaminopimelate/putrescine aminotransferase n=1 Tax=Lishizhenia tianjinensis TaxID=477690 RepID=A0A1I6XQZ8_9FLAO|nr:aspartate aminotransferase family protein [Lishizhenia tianjinensis]SFT40472.1 Acetylornithine/succinyldiaminopimelate/putrescine aminotransferase [Lishizhenia tianjinensis]